MTDQEKLQKLFQAALKDSSNLNSPPTRAFPNTVVSASPVPAPAPAAAVIPPQAVVPAVAPVAAGEAVASGPSDFVVPMENAGLDDASSRELARLLDERHARQAAKRRRNRIVTVVTMLTLTCSGAGWVAASPDRVKTFMDAMRDIRSVGDVNAMVAKFQGALDRISARGQQIDQARAAMGVEKSAGDEVDPYMDAEMQQLTRGEGKTVGERNRQMKTNFDHMKEKHAGAVKPMAKVSEKESFSWDE